MVRSGGKLKNYSSLRTQRQSCQKCKAAIHQRGSAAIFHNFIVFLPLDEFNRSLFNAIQFSPCRSACTPSPETGHVLFLFLFLLSETARAGTLFLVACLCLDSLTAHKPRRQAGLLKCRALQKQGKQDFAQDNTNALSKSRPSSNSPTRRNVLVVI